MKDHSLDSGFEYIDGQGPTQAHIDAARTEARNQKTRAGQAEAEVARLRAVEADLRAALALAVAFQFLGETTEDGVLTRGMSRRTDGAGWNVETSDRFLDDLPLPQALDALLADGADPDRVALLRRVLVTT